MVITYNHVKFIEQSVLSIIQQETDFPVFVNVIDDCSTDGTQEVLRNLQSRYPDRIRLFINEKNIGYKVTQRNFYRGFLTLAGDYIAILEGDDYWTDTGKLRKQVSFLEEHPDFAACAHNVLKVYDDDAREPHLFLPPAGKSVFDIFDLIDLSTYFHTTTLLYRNVFKGKPPRHFRDKYSCDLFITIAHAQFGKIQWFPDVMSVYRAHPGGRFSNMSETAGWIFNIDGLRRYNRWLGFRYFEAFCSVIYKYCAYLLEHGKVADGLTRRRRLRYTVLMHTYRMAHAFARSGLSKGLFARRLQRV